MYVYNIVQNDKNRKGGGIACYIRNNICFNLKARLSNNIEQGTIQKKSVSGSQTLPLVIFDRKCLLFQK